LFDFTGLGTPSDIWTFVQVAEVYIDDTFLLWVFRDIVKGYPMPAKKKMGGSTSWGITWADCGDTILAWEKEHNCRVDIKQSYAAVRKGSDHRIWFVGAEARSPNHRTGDPIGVGFSQLGGNRGAASMAGAVMSAAIQAVENLEERRAAPLKAQEVARLPGFD